jgi:hypothetical protein
MKTTKSTLRGVLAIALLALSAVRHASGDIVTEWNMTAMSLTPAQGPQRASRTLAILHASIYDAVNAFEEGGVPYHVATPPPAGASQEAAAAAAGFYALDALFTDPGARQTIRARYDEQAARIADGPAKAAGVAFGQSVAAALLALRANDGAAAAMTTPHPDGTEPGQWRRTASGEPMAPGWGNVTPWAMRTGDAFDRGGPPALTSPEYAAAYAQTRELGDANSLVRTADQTLAARFWDPHVPAKWHSLAREIAQREALSLPQSARLFGLLSVTLADTAIAGWNMKYRYSFWRPETAIRLGESDGNDATAGDPAWQPLLTSPAFPEYVSGHSLTCAAVARLLELYLGSGDYAFTLSTMGMPETRSYTSFKQAAEEAGLSRIHGGIHFLFSHTDGALAGTLLAERVFGNVMTPDLKGLERVGPVSATHGFPLWYQDKTGLVMEFGTPLNQAELDGGWLLLLPADVPTGGAPESFPENFAGEHFYWAGNARTDYPLPGGGTDQAELVLGLEAAFSVDEVVQGDQVAFGRLRIRMGAIPFAGTYTVYTPFGIWTFPDQPAGERLFFTSDIGVEAPFSGALNSDLGPFLLPSDTPGGPELPPVTGPVPGKLYIADPARLGPVTGSPLPPFTSTADGLVRNHNIFRIEGPNGFVVETSDFALAGRIFTDPLPNQVAVERAEYGRTSVTSKVDVMVTALPTRPGRLPASAQGPAVTPELFYYGAAPVTDPLTGALAAPAGVPALPLVRRDTRYWLQTQPAALPASVCLEDRNARKADGQVASVFQPVPVADEIIVSEASFDPAGGGRLLVRARSSDRAAPPVLTLDGFGNLGNNALLVSPLAAPPAKIRVRSSAGGANERIVVTRVGGAGVAGGPVALADQAATDEDVPVVIDVLANDTLNGAPVAFGDGVTLGLVGVSRLGTAAVQANGSLLFTPHANVSGADGITYTVSVNGVASRPAYVAVEVRPVADLPVAVDDAFTVTVGERVLPVLANDSHADGHAQMTNAVIVTPPQGGATAADGATVLFNAATGGVYSFSYQVQDRAGAVSANAANVTVTVAEEIITFVAAEFRTSQARWNVSGTDGFIQGQTLTITYADGTFAGGAPAEGTVIGTAAVDALGAWSLDLRDAAGELNPTSGAVFATVPTQLRVTSPLGGVRVGPFTVRN